MSVLSLGSFLVLSLLSSKMGWEEESPSHTPVSMSVAPPLCTRELIGPSLVRFGDSNGTVTDAMTFSRLCKLCLFLKCSLMEK